MLTLKVDNRNQKEAIAKAVQVLKDGGIVIYPTETCYGIGVDATNQQAVDRLIKYKAKREGKPMSVAVTGKEMAASYSELNETALNLFDNYLPGPITVVCRGKGKLAKGVESESETLGLRMPDNNIILEIVEELGRPVTSTSANASYKKTPYKVQDILDNLSEKQKELIDLIIDAGELPKNPPSTVVDTTMNEERILRQGEIKLSEIEELLTNSPEETADAGAELMKKYLSYLGFKSVVFALEGELGAGKTQFAKGIAQALKIPETVQSPTFVIEQEYKIPYELKEREARLFHIDTWRVEDESELAELGFVQAIDQGNVFVIEWADKIINLLKKVSAESVIVWVKIEYGQKENERKLTVSNFPY